MNESYRLIVDFITSSSFVVKFWKGAIGSGEFAPDQDDVDDESLYDSVAEDTVVHVVSNVDFPRCPCGCCSRFDDGAAVVASATTLIAAAVVIDPSS